MVLQTGRSWRRDLGLATSSSARLRDGACRMRVVPDRLGCTCLASHSGCGASQAMKPPLRRDPLRQRRVSEARSVAVIREIGRWAGTTIRVPVTARHRDGEGKSSDDSLIKFTVLAQRWWTNPSHSSLLFQQVSPLISIYHVFLSGSQRQESCLKPLGASDHPAA
jgi:hypothetical protein